jgi:hypothetical protein
MVPLSVGWASGREIEVVGAAGGGLGEGLVLDGGVLRVFRFHGTPAVAFGI